MSVQIPTSLDFITLNLCKLYALWKPQFIRKQLFINRNVSPYQCIYRKCLQGTEFDSTQGLLGGSVNRIGKMVSSGKGNRKLICYMVLLSVIMFFVIYFITKWSGGSKGS